MPDPLHWVKSFPTTAALVLRSSEGLSDKAGDIESPSFPISLGAIFQFFLAVVHQAFHVVDRSLGKQFIVHSVASIAQRACEYHIQDAWNVCEVPLGPGECACAVGDVVILNANLNAFLVVRTWSVSSTECVESVMCNLHGSFAVF